MFCCLFRKREQTTKLNHDLDLEQINVLISMDRESERTRSSSIYYTSSVYLKDTSIYRQFSDADELVIYEVLHTIIETVLDKTTIN
jgi:hypothetical protein